jgi:hypothetical protein
MLENIQRRATKLIPGLSDLSYEDRLCRQKLPSLSYRRSRGDMIEVYKIMSGKYDPEISNIFQLQEQENRNTRGHKYKLFKPRCRLNIRKNSFCIRVVNMWNNLSENVVTAKTFVLLTNAYKSSSGRRLSSASWTSSVSSESDSKRSCPVVITAR